MANTRKFTHRDRFITTESNTPNVLTPILTLTVPANSVVDFKQALDRPVIALFTAEGERIDAASSLIVGKNTPYQQTPVYAPEPLTLEAFTDLSTVQQRDANNAATLEHDFGSGIFAEEQESVVFYLNSPDVVDWTQPRATFEFWAAFDAV